MSKNVRCYTCKHFRITTCCDAPFCDKGWYGAGDISDRGEDCDDELMEYCADCDEYEKTEDSQ